MADSNTLIMRIKGQIEILNKHINKKSYKNKDDTIKDDM